MAIQSVLDVIHVELSQMECSHAFHQIFLNSSSSSHNAIYHSMLSQVSYNFPHSARRHVGSISQEDSTSSFFSIFRVTCFFIISFINRLVRKSPAYHAIDNFNGFVKVSGLKSHCGKAFKEFLIVDTLVEVITFHNLCLKVLVLGEELLDLLFNCLGRNYLRFTAHVDSTIVKEYQFNTTKPNFIYEKSLIIFIVQTKKIKILFINLSQASFGYKYIFDLEEKMKIRTIFIIILTLIAKILSQKLITDPYSILKLNSKLSQNEADKEYKKLRKKNKNNAKQKSKIQKAHLVKTKEKKGGYKKNGKQKFIQTLLYKKQDEDYMYGYKISFQFNDGKNFRATQNQSQFIVDKSKAHITYKRAYAFILLFLSMLVKTMPCLLLLCLCRCKPSESAVQTTLQRARTSYSLITRPPNPRR